MRTVSKGVTIVGFTQDQVKGYKNISTRADLVVDDSFNPNEYSIEEAVVVATDPDQPYFKKGDSVLIDFAIFTAGKKPQFENVPGTRYVGTEGNYECYFSVDPLHPSDVSEIFARISEEGKVTPIGDAVFIYPDDNKDQFVKTPDLYIPSVSRAFKPFIAKVHAVPEDCVSMKEGDEILCEPGFNVRIKYRGMEMEYINYPYIIGKMVDNELQLL